MISLFFLLLLSIHPSDQLDYVPDDKKALQYRSWLAGATRRELAPFQLCSTCRCCTADGTGSCLPMPCCFAITCDLPDKPFGICAFVPRTCNCTSCI